MEMHSNARTPCNRNSGKHDKTSWHPKVDHGKYVDLASILRRQAARRA